MFLTFSKRLDIKQDTLQLHYTIKEWRVKVTQQAVTQSLRHWTDNQKVTGSGHLCQVVTVVPLSKDLKPQLLGLYIANKVSRFG